MALVLVARDHGRRVLLDGGHDDECHVRVGRWTAIFYVSPCRRAVAGSGRGRDGGLATGVRGMVRANKTEAHCPSGAIPHPPWDVDDYRARRGATNKLRCVPSAEVRHTASEPTVGVVQEVR